MADRVSVIHESELVRSSTLFNPVVYLVDGFRQPFFGQAGVGVGWNFAATFLLAVCVVAVRRIFRTGYLPKQ
jgi:ABC-2 type transport system permease protein